MKFVAYHFITEIVVEGVQFKNIILLEILVFVVNENKMTASKIFDSINIWIVLFIVRWLISSKHIFIGNVDFTIRCQNWFCEFFMA